MKREAVFIAPKNRDAVLKFLVESLQRREIEVIVASVDSIHLHVLARFPDRDPRHWIGIAKKESSHHAKKMNCALLGGLWAVRTKDEPIQNRRHQVSTFRYILRHCDAGAAVWTIPKKRN
jgi:REP element-mobilizing transposase RayT